MSDAAVGKPQLRVARLDLWIDPVFDETIARDATLDLRVLPAGGDAETAAGL
ncbi:MAG TPA: 3-phosphoglycerate dehydrogenase, partial [Achromobacter sp.]|nr:3-phosphoglycerate dehydrogenase [Achromobacter sp.]